VLTFKPTFAISSFIDKKFEPVMQGQKEKILFKNTCLIHRNGFVGGVCAVLSKKRGGLLS
jgi:hypothetical protein